MAHEHQLERLRRAEARRQSAAARPDRPRTQRALVIASLIARHDRPATGQRT
jgi:hypothetical protein